MNWIRSILGRRAGARTKSAAVPPGEVVYAIGDVHGRSDLLRELLRKIEADYAARPDLAMTLITLGDYVDRGADSRGVIDILVKLKAQGGDRMIALKGNHEEALLNFLADPSSGAAWAEHGGREALNSYGLAPPDGKAAPEAWVEARDAFRAALPASHLEFLRGLHLHASVGDYVFVHAGVRAGLPLQEQEERDLLWIREEFIEGPPWSAEQVVVHGHTPQSGPVEKPGRIGLDTGAYATGVLTALRIEGDRRDYIRTGA